MSINFTSYTHPPHPRWYPESLKQPKTPPRHLPRNVKTSQNRTLNGQSRVIEIKGISQSKQYSMFLHWSFNNIFGMITIHAVSRVIQTPSWHLPDTAKSIYLLMLALWRVSEGKAVVEYDDKKWFLSIATPSIQSWQYPESIRHYPETFQTLSNHNSA